MIQLHVLHQQNVILKSTEQRSFIPVEPAHPTCLLAELLTCSLVLVQHQGVFDSCPWTRLLAASYEVIILAHVQQGSVNNLKHLNMCRHITLNL